MTKRSPPAPGPTDTPASVPFTVNGLTAKPTRRRLRTDETLDLRARLADAALEFTTLKRAEQLRKGVSPEKACEITEEYDPVVAMAMIGADTSQPIALRMAANSEVAAYVRPKLKSVEVISDAGEAELEKARAETATAIFAHLDQIAKARRAELEDRRQRGEVLLDQAPVREDA